MCAESRPPPHRDSIPELSSPQRSRVTDYATQADLSIWYKDHDKKTDFLLVTWIKMLNKVLYLPKHGQLFRSYMEENMSVHVRRNNFRLYLLTIHTARLRGKCEVL